MAASLPASNVYLAAAIWSALKSRLHIQRSESRSSNAAPFEHGGWRHAAAAMHHARPLTTLCTSP